MQNRITANPYAPLLLSFVFYIASSSATTSQGGESHLSILSVGLSSSIVPIYTDWWRKALRQSNVLAQTKCQSIWYEWCLLLHTSSLVTRGLQDTKYVDKKLTAYRILGGEEVELMGYLGKPLP